MHPTRFCSRVETAPQNQAKPKCLSLGCKLEATRRELDELAGEVETGEALGIAAQAERGQNIRTFGSGRGRANNTLERLTVQTKPDS